MCRIPHACRRHGRYVFRRRIHFRKIISKPLAIALKTADPGVARERAALLSARFAFLKSSVNKMIEAGRGLNSAEIEALFREELEDELRGHVQHAFEDGEWSSSALRIAADDAERYRVLSLPDRHDQDLVEYAREMIPDECIAHRLKAIGAPVDSRILAAARTHLIRARAVACARVQRLFDDEIMDAPDPVQALMATYTWDAPGLSGSYAIRRLTSFSDGTGTTSFAYDHHGNLIDRRQTVGSATADVVYAYDLADRITQITYPSGRLVAYDRDGKGRVAQVRTKGPSDGNWTTLVSAITYEPWGSITAAQFGNGLSLAETWTDGLLASKRLYNTSTGTNLSSLAYAYDREDNIASIRDQLNDANSAYYGYDRNNRLTFASLTVGTPTNDNEAYGYTSGTNQLASVVNASGTRSITYDARGNTMAEVRPASATVSATYDGYGRLLTYVRVGEAAQSNLYNGLDDRVSVTSGSTTHSFVYDSDHRLVGEYDASGAPIAETIWLSPSVASPNEPIGGADGAGGYAPLAIAVSGNSPAIYWVHGNQFGVPIVTTDATGAYASPSGYTVLGFPGQTKTLGDIYYNRYRDYDSSLGRYIQADPIGLRGGANPYVYALDNPLRYTDPSGRSPLLWMMAFGAAYQLGYEFGQNLVTGCWTFDFISVARGAAFWGTLELGGELVFGRAGGALAGEAAEAGGGPAGSSGPGTGGPGTGGAPGMGDGGSAPGIGGDGPPSNLPPGANGGPPLDTPTLVCRGGSCTAQAFENGSGVTIVDGNLQGVSVNSAPGATIEDLTGTIPHGRVGVTTVEDIEAAGGTVTPDPTPNNPYHCTMCGITPEKAEQLFTPTIPNPHK